MIFYVQCVLFANICIFVVTYRVGQEKGYFSIGMQKVTVFIYRLTDPIYR